MQYNLEHNITPKTIKKDVRDVLEISSKNSDASENRQLSRIEKEQLIKQLSAEMRRAAQLLEFEQAAFLRDKIARLRGK